MPGILRVIATLLAPIPQAQRALGGEIGTPATVIQVGYDGTDAILVERISDGQQFLVQNFTYGLAEGDYTEIVTD